MAKQNIIMFSLPTGLLLGAGMIFSDSWMLTFAFVLIYLVFTVLLVLTLKDVEYESFKEGYNYALRHSKQKSMEDTTSTEIVDPGA